MKKIICVLLSIIMSVSLVSFPAVAQAKMDYSIDSSVFTTNVGRIKEYLRNFGTTDANGNKMVKVGNYYVVYNVSEDDIDFLADVVNSKGDVVGNINMYYECKFNYVYIGPKVELYSSPWSAVGKVEITAHDYTYGQGLDFNVDNKGTKTDDEVKQKCNQLFKDAIDGWNNCLAMYAMPLLSQLGFNGLCEHKFARTYSPASTGAAGSYKDYCKNCGYYKITTIPWAYDVKINCDEFYYNGSAQKPTVSVLDDKGNPISPDYYTVTYSNPNSSAVGSYYLIVKFKEPFYTGSKTLSYKIMQKSGSSAPVKASGSSKPTSNSSSTSKPKAVQIKKLTPAKKSLTVSWAKGKNINGYQIQLSTDKKFKKNKKTVSVKKQKTTKATVKKLKAKKKYYVKVRTYKTVNGKKIYSSWSKTKSVKVK